MNPDFSLWARALGALMVGFFALNVWARWLDRRRTAPRWGRRVPQLVLGLLLVSTAVGGYYQWRIVREAPALAPQAREAAVKLWRDSAGRAVQVGLAGVGAGGAVLLLATLIALTRKPPQAGRRAG
jgi:hypothetical protein